MSTLPPSEPDPRDAFFDTGRETDGLGRQVANVSIGVLAISALKVLVMFAGVAILARLVVPAEYGIFALAMPVIAISLSLSSLGLPQAIVQRPQITHAEASTLFWMNIGFATVIAALFAAMGGFAARIFDTPEVAGVYRVIAISVVFGSMVGLYGAIMQRQLKARRFEIMVLGGDIAGLLTGVVTALAGWSYWALVAQQVVSQAVPVILLMAQTRWLPSSPMQARFGPVRDAMQFGGYVAGVGMLNKLNTYIIVSIVGATMGPAATGLLHRALRLGNLPPLRVMAPLSSTFMVALSRLQDDPDALRVMYVRMISRSNIILMPVAVLIATGAAPIVELLLGPDWTAATPLLAWMSIMTLRAGATYGLRYLLLGTGHSKQLFFNAILRSALLAAAIYASASYGLVIMTATFMLTELFITLPMMIYQALCKTPVDLGCIARASLWDMALAAGIAGVLMVGVDPLLTELPAVLHLAALMVVIGAIYAVRIALSPELRRDVMGIVIRLLHRLRPLRKNL